MPELPEVEVVRRDLEKEIVGRRIKEVEVRPGSNAMKVIRRHGRRKEFQELLEGAKVNGIGRLGRRLLFDLDNDRVLVLDLGSHGVVLKTSVSDGLASHTHIVIGFTIGGQLRIIDPKLDGEVFVGPRDEIEADPELRRFAIDPLDAQQLTWPHFSALLNHRRAALKELLMDQDFICGLGDIYSDEILFTAGLRYDRESNRLTSQDVRRLYRALIETLQDAVKAGGTTWGVHEFRDLQGNPGQYQLELKVYERAGESCRRCRHQIERVSFDGKHTYLCPQCQS